LGGGVVMVGVAIFEPPESGYEAFLKQFWGPIIGVVSQKDFWVE